MQNISIEINKRKLGEDISLVNYNKIIQEAKSKIPKNGNCILEFYFDNSIKIYFVDPLFLITILNLYEEIQKEYLEQDIRLVLNIKNLDKKPQEYILIFLAQYIDCHEIEIFTKEVDVFLYAKKKLVLFSSHEEDNKILLFDNQEYPFLPIVKIGNNHFNDNFSGREYWVTKEGKREEQHNQNRKIFYKSLQLDTLERGVYKNKSEKVWKDIFETYLKLTKNGAYITSKFQDIFREMVENIEKHIKEANGYIAFHKDTHCKSHNQFEFIVADDYEQGFLTKYLETMIAEKEYEPNKQVKKGYQEIIDDIQNGEYKRVLENIFSLNYVLSSQKERMTKHFGLPLLLKIVRELEEKSLEKYGTDEYVKLQIHLNYNEKCFKVVYHKGKAKAFDKDDGILDNGFKGTCFYLSFPEKLHIDDPKVSTAIPLKLTSKQYKDIFIKKEIIETQLEKFKYYFSFKDLKDKTKPNQGIESIVIDYSEIQGTSDFLRYLFSYAYIYDLKDILVVNTPIEKELNYLEHFCYSSDLSKIANIVFLNVTYPQILFIGGVNDEGLLKINTRLSQTYNYNKRNFLKNIDLEENENIPINSNLFFRNDKDEEQIIPFELFLPNPIKKNELLYTNMLDNFLNLKENYEKISLDLKNGFHINKFYYLKHIFENSQWFKLLSFDLARKFELEFEKRDREDIIVVGLEKYSSIIISEIQYILDKFFNTYFIPDIKNGEILEQFEEFKKDKKARQFIFFRPSIFESSLRDLYRDLNDFKLYSAITLTTEEIGQEKWDTLYMKNLDDIIVSSNDLKCLESNEPLYVLDEDKYNIKNLYHKYFETIDDEIMYSGVCWKGAVFFPHVIRNTNHYLYYIRSTQFFYENRKKIETHYEHYKLHQFEDDNKIPVIITSNHDTNSQFISLVNRIIFNNDAIVHTLSLENKEQGYYLIDNLDKLYKDKKERYSFYLVDDAISSGETLKYLFSIINSFFETKFKTIFTMIDRRHYKDKNILSNYYENFSPFIRLHIHPIKTGFESCFLCDREKHYKEIAYESSLVINKATFLKKAKDLEKQDSQLIEYTKLNAIDDFKNYLRLSSTEYIYQNMNSFNSYASIDYQFDLYYEEVKEYFEEYYLDDITIFEDDSIDRFLKFETKIAYIKSLAFPKISFFMMIRDYIQTYIVKYIREYTNLPKRKKEIEIITILEKEDFEYLDTIESIKDIVEYYKKEDRTNIDTFNFLISQGSFLGINHILSNEVIRYYYLLTLEIKEAKIYERYKRLLGVYPMAVKQLVSYSVAESEYFHKQLSLFYTEYNFQYTRQFSRIFGLYVENTKFLKMNSSIWETVNKYDSLNKNIENFNLGLKKLVSNSFQNLKLSNIYIDINESTKEPQLIDISNNYKEVLTSDIYVKAIYKSAYIKDSIDFIVDIDIEHDEIKANHPDSKKRNNIWCNFYKDFRTYIRITNHNLKPLGVIVIEHTNKNNLKHNLLVEHIQISQLILSYQNVICELFTKIILISAIRIKNDELIEQKRKEDRNLKLLIDKSSHGAKNNIWDAIDNFHHSRESSLLELWIGYCNLTIGRMYMLDIEKYDQIIKQKVFRDISLNEINELFKLFDFNYPDFSFIYDIDYNMFNSMKIDPTHLKIFLILFISNAIKYSNEPSNIHISFKDFKLKIINEKLIKNISPGTINKILTTNPIDLMSDSEEQDKTAGITLYTINKFLNVFSYKMHIEIDNGKFILNVFFKEYK